MFETQIISEPKPLTILVGGFPHPFEKYANRQIGSFPQIFGGEKKNIWVATRSHLALLIENCCEIFFTSPKLRWKVQEVIYGGPPPKQNTYVSDHNSGVHSVSHTHFGL